MVNYISANGDHGENAEMKLYLLRFETFVPDRVRESVGWVEWQRNPTNRAKILNLNQYR
jgi:hypothetical protein